VQRVKRAKIHRAKTGIIYVAIHNVFHIENNMGIFSMLQLIMTDTFTGNVQFILLIHQNILVSLALYSIQRTSTNNISKEKDPEGTIYGNIYRDLVLTKYMSSRFSKT
jgi:hypothetical protein